MWRGVVWCGVMSSSVRPGEPHQVRREEDCFDGRTSFSRLPTAAARSGEHARPAVRQPAVTEILVHGEAPVLGGNMLSLAGCMGDLARSRAVSVI